MILKLLSNKHRNALKCHLEQKHTEVPLIWKNPKFLAINGKKQIAIWIEKSTHTDSFDIAGSVTGIDILPKKENLHQVSIECSNDQCQQSQCNQNATI